MLRLVFAAAIGGLIAYRADPPLRFDRPWRMASWLAFAAALAIAAGLLIPNPEP